MTAAIFQRAAPVTIDRQQGKFFTREDPFLTARAVAMKRQLDGCFPPQSFTPAGHANRARRLEAEARRARG